MERNNNEYQEALEKIKNTNILKAGSSGLTVGDRHESEFKLLQELIDLNTSKKVQWLWEDEPSCPNCGEVIEADNSKRCEFCEQKLDWSEDNGN